MPYSEVKTQAATDRDFAIEVVQRLRAAGYEALWAGGCVRDLLMGNVPSDYDVATSATPQQVRRLFGRSHSLPVGLAFGVIIVQHEQRLAQHIEVATFRMDAGYSDGRRPDAVTYSTPREDALRRDFTINGMFFDPIEETVVDYVGGREDLDRRLIRAIGSADARIGEDKLRMLRAIRFAARFRFELDEATRQAIARHASDISIVSCERIAVEVQKTLHTHALPWAVGAWHHTGLLQAIFPYLDAGWQQAGGAALALLDAVQLEPAWQNPDQRDWRVAMAAIIWALSSTSDRDQVAGLIRAELKLSTADGDALRTALELQSMLESAMQKPWSAVQPALIHPHIGTALGLLAARSRIGQVSSDLVEWLRRRLAWPQHQLNPSPLVDGADLIEMGFQPGPRFSALLNQVRQLQLDQQLHISADAKRWIAEFGQSESQ